MRRDLHVEVTGGTSWNDDPYHSRRRCRRHVEQVKGSELRVDCDNYRVGACSHRSTAMLVMGLSAVTQASNALSSGLSPFLCGLVVFSIGLSLGGPTGYAINPARDPGPRISHAILPIPGKRDSDWEYSWVPVVGPIIGGVLGYAIFSALW